MPCVSGPVFEIAPSLREFVADSPLEETRLEPPVPSFRSRVFYRSIRTTLLLELGRGVLFRSRRVRGVELPITLLDPASSFVPGNGDAGMVRANPGACGGDFLLRLARCQGKDLIAEAWRAAISASWFRRCGAPAPARLC